MLPDHPPDPAFPCSSILETLKADYQRFPQDQTYSLYAPDVFFQDPLNSFRGVDRYRQMIAFMTQWFQEPRLDLHHISQTDRHIHTEWTLSWIFPLPWRPHLSISGYTEMELNPEGLIQSHRDYWHCSRWDVLRQAIGMGGKT